MIDSNEFPRLTSENHRITSPPSEEYNCIAWAAGDMNRWWEPGVCWPVTADGYGLDALQAAFQAIGYESSGEAGFEQGFDKVALYSSGRFYTHAARQLPTGKWTSKLGRLEDIEHDTPDCIAGGAYGKVAGYMKRKQA